MIAIAGSGTEVPKVLVSSQCFGSWVNETRLTSGTQIGRELSHGIAVYRLSSYLLLIPVDHLVELLASLWIACWGGDGVLSISVTRRYRNVD